MMITCMFVNFIVICGFTYFLIELIRDVTHLNYRFDTLEIELYKLKRFAQSLEDEIKKDV